MRQVFVLIKPGNLNVEKLYSGVGVDGLRREIDRQEAETLREFGKLPEDAEFYQQEYAAVRAMLDAFLANGTPQAGDYELEPVEPL